MSKTRFLLQKRKKTPKSVTTSNGVFDYSLLVILAILLTVGLVTLGSSASYLDQKEHPGAPGYTLIRQMIFLAMALVVMGIVAKRDYHVLLWLGRYGYPIAVLLGILVLFFGKEVNGQKRWFALGPLSFQPAEFAKLTLILTLGRFFSNSQGRERSLGRLAAAGLLTLPLFLPVVEANLSSGIIIAGIAAGMSFIWSKRRGLFVLALFLGLGACIVAFQSGLLEAILDEYQMNRIYAWLDPEAFPLSNGFQVLQGLYAIGAGGMFGIGWGNSLQKLGYLPEAQNDMIFSVICEEAGLVGACLLILLFLLLLWRFLVIAVQTEEPEGFYLVCGVICHILLQVLLNIAVVTNTIPNTGISLPFISYGGSSLFFLLTEIGIVFSVSRRNPVGY